MATIVKRDEEKDFEIHPAGLFQAVCLFVEDVGLQKTPGFQGAKDKIQRKVVIVWESEAAQNDGSKFILSKKYTASFFKEARLLKDLEAWRGRKFTEQELDGFDIDTVIGANCLLNIVHNEKEGKTYVNIAGIVPLKNGMSKLVAETKGKPEWFTKWIGDLRSKQVTAGEAQAQARSAPPPHDDSDTLPF